MADNEVSSAFSLSPGIEATPSPGGKPVLSDAEQSKINYKYYADQNKYYWEGLAREAWGGATLELGNLITDRGLDDNTKRNLLQQKADHPVAYMLANTLGVVAGTVAVPESLAARLTGVGKVSAEAYRFAQGASEAKTLAQAAKLGVVEGGLFGLRDVVNTESLDPNFTIEHSSDYVQDIMKGAGYGLGGRIALHGIGELYGKYVKGQDELNSEIPVTIGESEKFGSRLAKTNNAYTSNDEINAAVANNQKAAHLASNISFLNDMDDKASELVNSIKNKEEIDTKHPGNKAILFLNDLSGAPDTVKQLALGRKSANDLYDKWSKRYELYHEYGEDFDSIKNSLTRDAQESANQSDFYNLKARRIVEDTLDTSTKDYFSDINNNTINDKFRAGVMGKDGIFKKTEQIFDEAQNPIVYAMDPVTKKPRIGPDGNPIQLDPMTEKNLYEARKAVLDANRPNQQYTVALKNLYEEFKNSIAKPISETSDTYLLRKGLTPEQIYSKTQQLRKSFNDKAYSLRKELGGAIVGQKEDVLLSQVKSQLSNYIESNFGEFGKTSVRKTQLIDALNNAQENLLLFMNRKKSLPNAPRKVQGREYYDKRGATIKDVWTQVRNVTDDTPKWKNQTANFKGELQKTQEKINGAFSELNSILPNEELAYLNAAINDQFKRKQDIVDKISLLNDKTSGNMFQKGSMYKQAEEAGYGGGMSTKRHIILGLKDFFAGFINPADFRFAQLQAFRVLENVSQGFIQKTFKTRKPIVDNAENIVQNRMQEYANMLEKTSKMTGMIKDVASSILNVTKPIVRSSVPTYTTMSNNSDHINEVNSQFEKIAKNLRGMQGDPGLYAQRMDFALSSLRQLSPEISEGIKNRMYNQIGMINRIFPKSGDGTPYKVDVPLALKAKFLDNVDALTNPNKILDMMRSGTATSEQISIFKMSHPDIWNKTLQEVTRQMFYTNPPPEAQARAYGLFGIKSIQSQMSAERFAQQMIQQQIMNQSPKRQPKLKNPYSDLKGLTKGNNLTPQGVND